MNPLSIDQIAKTCKICAYLVRNGVKPKERNNPEGVLWGGQEFPCPICQEKTNHLHSYIHYVAQEKYVTGHICQNSQNSQNDEKCPGLTHPAIVYVNGAPKRILP